MLLLYTDGTTEARDAAGIFFPLTEYLGGAVFDEPGELVEMVLAGLRVHAGVRLEDDVALVALRRKANAVGAVGAEAVGREIAGPVAGSDPGADPTAGE
jgi:hypothetical protein